MALHLRYFLEGGLFFDREMKAIRYWGFREPMVFFSFLSNESRMFLLILGHTSIFYTFFWKLAQCQQRK